MKNKEENAFLRVLPKFFSKGSMDKMLRSTPQLNKNLKGENRLSELNEIRYNWFQPLRKHRYLGNKILSLLTASYKYRTEKWTTIKLWEIKNWYNNPYQKPKDVETAILGFTIIGLPGVGKTTSMDRVLGLIPQVIDHGQGQIQITYLKIDCTYKGSTKQMCLAFFSELDRLTGENYSANLSRETEEKLIIQMANKAVLYRIGVLIVDEVHNLRSSKKEVREKVLDFLKEITNKIGMPIIYVGTPQAVPILSGNFQVGSRATGVGSNSWDRLIFESKDWDKVLNELWTFQILKKPGILTEELQKLYYKHSGGVLRVLVSVHCIAQELAIYHKKESISVDLLEKARQQLFLIDDALSGLDRKNPYVLKKYNDLNIAQMELIDQDSSQESNVDDELVDKLWNKLKSQFKKLDQTKLMQLTQGMVNLKGNDTDPAVVYTELVNAVKLIEKVPTVKVPKGNPKGDMVDATENSKSVHDNYQLLKEAGFTKIPGALIF